MVFVRGVGAADAAAMAEIHTEARSAYYAAAGVERAQNAGAGREEREAMWQAFIADPNVTLLGADEDGALVGFIAWGTTPTASEIDERAVELMALYVDPGRWGRGVAGQLYDRFTEHLDSLAVSLGVLEVWECNERASEFYRRRGWRPQGKTRPGPRDAPFVTLRLAR